MTTYPAYQEIDQETFDSYLQELVEWEAAGLLSIPGVYEAVSEHYNNVILERWDEENSHYLDFDTVVEDFEENIKPAIEAQYGHDDYIAIREAFNDFTDGLCKDDQISQWAYENWPNPY